MNTSSTNSANKISRVAKITKTRLSIITLFVLLAVFSTAVFSATTSASSLDKFFENNLPAPIASGLSSISNAVFGTTNFANASQVIAVLESAPAPSVMTDKDDYQPGEWATITGSGFIYPDADGNPVVETSVTLQVLHVDGTPNTGNGHEMRTVSINGDGTFTTQWYVDPDDSLGAIFKVTAIGTTSGLKAERVFTDAPLADCTTYNAELQGQSANSTTWISGNLAGWQELQYIRLRVNLTTSNCTVPAAGIEKNITVRFPHTQAIQDLTNFAPSSGVVIVTPPVLNSPATGDWSYTFKVRLTAGTGDVQFQGRLSAGAHNFNGSSLALGGSPSLGTLQISKPSAAPGSPNLVLSKSGPGTANPGQTITYTLSYQNVSSSTSPATGVQLIDTLPSNFTYVPGSCSGCTVVGNTVTWDLATLAIGATGSKSLQVTVAQGIIPQTITNNANILSAENDLNPADNTATKSTVINNSPSISTQPANATACVGGSVTFSVTASGSPAPTYQWRKGGVNIGGATSSSYTISSVNSADEASYDVVVSNSAGTATSSAATLTVNTAPSITGQPQNATKTVGDLVTFTVTATGSGLTYQWRKGSVNISNATSDSYTIPSVVTADAGTYDVVVSGGCSPSVTSSAATLTVNKKMPVISWNNPSDITYGTALGGTQLNAAASYNGSSVAGSYSYTPASGAVLSAGNGQTLSVTFTPTDTNTYDTPAAKTVQINVLKKQLTVTADNANRAYGAPNPSNLTYTITGGYENGDTSAVISGSPALTIANTATATAAAGSTHTITAALGNLSASNYSFAFVNGTLTIDKAVLQVSATGTMTYGGTPTLTPSYSGFIGTDNSSVVTGTPALSCPTCSGAVAGTTQTINVSNGNPALSATNYSFNFVNGSLTVAKAVLQVSATGSMTYGGTPTLTPTYSGFIASEGVSVLNGTAPALSCSGCTGAAAGSTQTITVAAGNLAASNYSFNFVNGSLTIDKAVLQVSATGSMTYGGTPTLTPTYSGFIGTDNASVITGTPNLSCPTCTGAAAGTTQTINVANGSPALSATNYNFNFVTGSLTVSKAVLQVSATGSMTYGGTPTLTPSYSGFVGTDNTSVITGTPTLACPTCSGGAAGSTKTINVTDGNPALSATNYSFSFVNGSLTVDKAVLTVKADNLSRAYGDTNPTPTYSINGFVNSENATSAGVTGTPTLSIAATASATAAAGTTHAITVDSVSGMSATNYSFTLANGTLTITLRAVTVKAANASKTYGDPTPSYSIQLANGTLATGDNLGSLGTPIFTTNPANPVDVGTYPIDVSGLSNSNYNISYAASGDRGALTINKASSTVVVSFGTGPYTFRGSAFTATARVMGVGGLDAEVTPVNYTGDCTNVTTTNGCTASANYAGDANHNSSNNSASITISKASATINVVGGTFPYDGAAHGATGTATGINGEDLNSLLSLGNSFTNVPGGTANWSFPGNANYNSAGGSANIVISKASSTVTVTFETGPYTYRGSAFTATARVTGAGGLNAAVTPVNYSGDCTNVTTTNGCTAAANFAGDTNHNASSDSKSVTIVKADQTITFGALANKTFGNAAFTVTATATSNLAVSFTASGNCSVTGGTVTITGAGSCIITAKQAGNNNYNAATDVPQSFTIGKAGQTIIFAALINKFIGNGGITVGATGGGSGNPVTFASSTTSVCTSGGTNGATITFVGLGTCTITASQLGNNDYNAATSVIQSFNVNSDPTTVTLNTAGHTFIDFDCTTNVIAATVIDSITGLPISGATVTFSIGTQSATATTNNSGVASVAIVLNQPTGSVTVSASYAGSSNGFNSAGLSSTTKTIGGSPNVGPGQDATSLYTGSLWFWTTSSTSSTATLTLSATIKDTFDYCPGDITKAKVSFLISTNGGTSFSPVSSAQNLPVGLVNPNDPTTGTASAISQYNIGSSQSVTLMVRVVVGGQYNSSSSTYDVPVTIGKPGLANSLMGGGKLKNDGMPLPANGFLGANSIDSVFGTQVTYNSSGTNPKGDVTVTITSCNKPDGSVEAGCTLSTPAKWHKYFIKSNAISELSLISGSASFGSKTNVSELLPDGSKVGLDGGNTMQIVFTPNGNPFPTGMSVTGGNCTNQSGCASIVIYKSNGLGGGVWYSSAWGQNGTTAPRTYLKNVFGGNVVIQ